MLKVLCGFVLSAVVSCCIFCNLPQQQFVNVRNLSVDVAHSITNTNVIDALIGASEGFSLDSFFSGVTSIVVKTVKCR